MAKDNDNFDILRQAKTAAWLSWVEWPDCQASIW